MNEAQVEALANADAHTSNAGMPTYTELLTVIRDLAAAEGLPAGYANRKMLIQAARDALHKATGE